MGKDVQDIVCTGAQPSTFAIGSRNGLYVHSRSRNGKMRDPEISTADDDMEGSFARLQVKNDH